MAKEVAISKRIKISQAQEYIILAVLGASVVFGIALALTIQFIKQISFNGRVIAEEDKSISAYSEVIKNVGVCKAPNGENYNKDELSACDPSSIEISEIPGTLRANILEDLAANKALNSVPKSKVSSCLNPSTGKDYTYKELDEKYSQARDVSELQSASALIKNCSALRVIPDALPYFKNEEALLASLNKIYIISNWEPESLSPSGDASSPTAETGEDGAVTTSEINGLMLNSEVNMEPEAAMILLRNMERSIREFDVKQMRIEWADDKLDLDMQLNAYYIGEATIEESSVTISPEEDSQSSSGTSSSGEGV